MFIIFRSILLAFLVLNMGFVYAQGQPARSEILTAGPYTIIMSFSQDPPEVETPLEVTIKNQSGTMLSGRIVAQPGLGTDGATLYTQLRAVPGEQGTLVGTVHLPVRGAWNIIADLNGPHGRGTASIAVTVSAPNAIPIWLGWLIGLSPLLGCIWLAWWLWNYRYTLLAKSKNNSIAANN